MPHNPAFIIVNGWLTHEIISFHCIFKMWHNPKKKRKNKHVYSTPFFQPWPQPSAQPWEHSAEMFLFLQLYTAAMFDLQLGATSAAKPHGNHPLNTPVGFGYGGSTISMKWLWAVVLGNGLTLNMSYHIFQYFIHLFTLNASFSPT